MEGLTKVAISDTGFEIGIANGTAKAVRFGGKEMDLDGVTLDEVQRFFAGIEPPNPDQVKLVKEGARAFAIQFGPTPLNAHIIRLDTTIELVRDGLYEWAEPWRSPGPPPLEWGATT